MENVALSHKTQPKKHLLCVCSNGSEIDPNISAKFLENFTKVDTQMLKYHA